MTTFEELSFLGSTYVTRGIVTERSDERIGFRGESSSVRSEGFREAVADGERTRATYALHLEPRGAFRFFATILRPIYPRCIASDLARLKALLEA